ncbi:MAG TPA: serine/threonine-protein kinase, partial [Minicystis sp.]|nr:serine/threonine-protein kinase [Minicystis sp.]
TAAAAGATTELAPRQADTLLAPATGEAPPARAVVRDAPRYAWVEVLGEGGMGRVARVRDRDLLRDVAMKVVRGELVADAAALERFLFEARVTAYLDHPNIVPVHDVGLAADGEPFFTMKLVRGASLEAWIASLRDGRAAGAPEPGLARRLRLFLQLAGAVAFAHARGVLHRDLKPANVMVAEYGEVLVTDWGLALPLPGDAGEAVRGLMPEAVAVRSAGTPMYMPPEQIRGEQLDARADVYALGAILFELVALRPAHDAPSLDEVLRRTLEGEPPSLRAAVPDAPSSLAAVVAKAMARERDARYASVDELVEDVETVLDGRTPRADAAPLLKQAARYYLGRDPALARLRVADLDLWMGGSWMFGLGLGALLAARLGGLAYGVLVAGVLLMVPTTVRWLRARRERARH